MKKRSKSSNEQLERVGGALRRICEQIALTREVMASHFDLQRTDRVGLDFIFSRGGTCTAGELSKATGLTTGSTTALIDRLEAAGYAVREPDPNDRRKQVIRIAQQVFAECEALYGPIRAGLFRFWSSYSADELECVAGFLSQSAQLYAGCLESLKANAAHVSSSGASVATTPPRGRR